MIRRLAVLLAGCAVWGACSWERSNPYDQARCDPRCVGGERCFEGRCVSGDSGPADLRDAGLNCGNGEIDPGEQCDKSALGGQTCAAQGFLKGTLSCMGNCSFDTSGCFYRRLDVPPIALTDDKRVRLDPRAASGDSSWLVVWDEGPDASADIFGARVDRTGTVQDSPPFQISGGANDQILPAVSFDGANFLVAWQDMRDGTAYTVYGARVTQDSAVLDPNGSAIDPTVTYQYAPSIVYNGTSSLVLWESLHPTHSAYNVNVARIPRGATPLSQQTRWLAPETSFQQNHVSAFDGANALVVWEKSASGTELPNIYAGRASSGGELQGSTFALASGESQRRPAVAFGGGVYLVVWSDTSGGKLSVHGSRVDPGGGALGSMTISATISAETEYLLPAVVFDGTSFLVAWSDKNSGDYDIRSRFLLPSGAMTGDTFDLVEGPGDQTSPAFARGADQLLLVWVDNIGSNGAIMAQRLEP